MHPTPNAVVPIALFFAFLPFLILLLLFAVFAVSTIFWIWTLVDCATREPSEGNDKVIWILVIIFSHFIGALIYAVARRPERIRLYGK
jgi:hypothetical protein